MFRSSTPVSSAGFSNRTSEVASLERQIAKLVAGVPSWVALLGPRKIGKTSLVLELARRTAAKGRSRVVFVVIDSFEDTPVGPGVFRRFALRALDAIFSSEAGASLEAASLNPSGCRVSSQHTPRFASLPPALRAWILDLPDRAVDEALIRACLDLPQRLATALDLTILVAWDEFQELATLATTARLSFDVLPLVRSIWQRHAAVGYFISGSARSLLRDLITRENSPFFQHFSILEVGPFTREDAIALLLDGSASERPIPRAVAAKAVDVLGGFPFYLQLLGEALEQEPGGIDDDALKAALQGLLFSRTGRLALYFEGQYRELVGRSTYLSAVLQALAAGPRRLSEVAATIKATAGATIGYLERLGDTVRRAPDGAWQLDDPTFGVWLSWREPGGTVIPMKLIGDEGEQAVAVRLAQLGFDLVYQSRASRGAFDLLATRGSQQLGVQVKRTQLPVRFAAAEWARMEAEASRFGWVWTVAAADASGHVTFLDPGRATGQKARQLGDTAAIENVLEWLDATRIRRRRSGR